ncbi:hypothetical protein M885DRAFT_528187 [Pelagophyceae sp. CCMP2097]|nr:hypothetical protein M885DRAFT_528187 [Pelagophyceae sp. CCMP2097]|mmetsp:Transcript_6940/g.22510  ORF Transcript_6940/g.22510 Transcript_6940/m.22510 type:complete len:645 (+) Transcript_6940:62-1996(+)
MPDIKRTRKGRPTANQGRSALIISRGKSHGRDAANAPKRGEAKERTNLFSTLDEKDSVETFLERIELSATEYAFARDGDSTAFVLEQEVPEGRDRLALLLADAQEGALFRGLPVPRRPAWAAGDAADDVQEREEEAFVDWRRGIASLEEAERFAREADGRLALSASVATPFERNLEVWRQLWRTVERSDCVFFIVDARWPDFYLSYDAVDLARSLRKRVVVVVNKADYLAPAQRKDWRRHFDARGVRCAFFSARAEQKKLDAFAKAQRDADVDAAQDGGDDDDAPEAPVAKDSSDGDTEAAKDAKDDGDTEFTRLLTPDALLAFGEAQARASRFERFGNDVPVSPETGKARLLCVGMVGYPNVGKSSCVNVLRGATAQLHGVGARAAVSATPGKTKHLQTLVVGPDLELCDCPGLVFPALVTHGAAELACSGVVPLAKLRDLVGAAELVATRIPRTMFDLLYGTSLCRGHRLESRVAVKDLLDAYCTSRRCISAGSGDLDHRTAARALTADYVDGVLLYCHPPPDCADRAAYDACSRETAAQQSLKLKLDAVRRRKEAFETSTDTQAKHITTSRDAALVAAAAIAGFLPSEVDADSPVLEELPPAPLEKKTQKLFTNRNNKWGKKGKKFRDNDPYAPKEKEAFL